MWLYVIYIISENNTESRIETDSRLMMEPCNAIIGDRACKNRPCGRKKSPIFSVFVVS